MSAPAQDVTQDDPADRRISTVLRAMPRATYLLIAGVAINRMGSFVQIFLILFLTTEGRTAEQAGLALTVYGIGAVLGILAGGTVTERIGVRPTISLSMLASGTFIGAIPFCTSQYPLLLVLCLCAGLAAQLYRPAASLLLATLTPPHQLVLVSAVYRLGLNIGAAVGPLLGALVILYSYTALFLLNMATAVAFGLAAWMWLPAADQAERERPRSTYAVVFADRRFLLFVLSLFVISIVEIQYTVVLPLEVVERGLSNTVYGALLALNGVLVIAVELLITRYVQNWPMRVSITLGIGLIAGGIAAYGIPGAGWLFAATVVWTLGEIVAAPSVQAYPALVADTGVRGRYIALSTGSQSIGYAAGPAVGVFLWQGMSGGTWLVCAVLGLGAAALSWVSVRHPEAMVDD